jgi:inhibitor of cysteine peptidase
LGGPSGPPFFVAPGLPGAPFGEVLKIRRSYLPLLLVAFATAFAISLPKLAVAGVIGVTEADNGREFTLARGDTLEVSLPATSGTGYTWQAAPIADALVKQVGDLKFKVDNAMPGASGHQIFRFSIEASGTGTLEIHYIRPWEKDARPAKVFRILLIVR